MNDALSRILLIFLLLALNGQAFAAPCASTRDGDNSHHQGAEPATADHCAVAENAHHCESGDADETLEACEQACSCCPGHCASAMPGSEIHGSANLPTMAKAVYAELHSSPLPEAALRPPIAA
ncbi:hypothetical protein [Microbulbifer marinus]|uniref:Uncharacterized protein n=1 Tax=Microbulbifer marinus TaxID=658218 RepID=A0A1H4BE35_9GAMM|nr:hypothetical protein [Microbulbifer marinus]SEA46419.1 hypothetical protein SAMN05216562_3243 [Microbulbifer marinus]